MVQFSRYESYKDSGVEWIGEIPSDWKTNKIKHSCYVKGRIGWHGLSSDEYSDDGAFLVTGTDFDNGNVNWDSCHHISFKRYEEDQYIQLQENDLLITKDGTIGKTAIVKDLPYKATLNSGIFLVRALKSELNIFFLRYLLISNIFDKFLDYFQTGATVKHLYQETFGNFIYVFPALKEQQRIVDFLDCKTAEIDEAIAKKQKLIELLQEQKAILINQAVTKGLNFNVPMRDSGIKWIGEIPEHWETFRLKNVIKKIEQGWSPQCFNNEATQNEWGVLKVGCVNGYKFNPNENKKLPPTLNPREELELKHKDILISRANTLDLVGSAACALNPREKLIICDKLYRVKVDTNRIEPEYLILLLQTQSSRNQIEIGANGASSSMQNIGQDIIKNLLIVLPDLKTQEKILSVISDLETKTKTVIQSTFTKIEKLKELKQVLISNAVTGKIKI